MSTDDGLPQHSPVGSRAEQHVIDNTITLKEELKTARKERDRRWSTWALIVAFLLGFIVCDVLYGGKRTHRLLLMIDEKIHPDPYND